MTGKFVTDLALSNLKRNRRAILPYALSCIGTVMVFFILYGLAYTNSFKGLYGTRTMTRTLQLGVIVMVLFSVIFLFYTHSFLIKRRKKEFGLFNLLGLEKKHLVRVLTVEALILSLATTVAGMVLGALLSKLMYLLILSTLGQESIRPFLIPRQAWSVTALVFLGVHLLTLLNTMREVHMARPVELLRGEKQGEREPKARLWLALIGLAALAAGYWISLSVKDAMTALVQFFLAVVLVILGTYLLFSAGMVSLIKLLQKNKRFYYQARHFSVVAGMRHRINRNAAGLATVCILSTMVLVMASATASMFVGREDLLAIQFPREAMLEASVKDAGQAAWVQQVTREVTQSAGLRMDNLSVWQSHNGAITLQEGGRVIAPASQADQVIPGRAGAGILLVDVADYEQLSGQQVQLAPGEALYYTRYGQSLPGQTTLVGHPLRLRERLKDIGTMDTMSRIAFPNYYVVLNPADLEKVLATWTARMAHEGEMSGVGGVLHQAFNTGPVQVDQAEQYLGQWRKQTSDLLSGRGDGSYSLSFSHEVIDRADFNALYGGLLFVAIFLGLVFTMAMVMIIYYKQVSEGYEDQGGYLILQQVGMSQEEVRQTIRSQVLIVFFLPLAMAGLHLMAAFNILWQVLKMLSMSNRQMFALVCLISYLVFALFYLLVYQKTARSYYRIVRA